MKDNKEILDYPLLAAAIELYQRSYNRIEISISGLNKYYNYVLSNRVANIYDINNNLVKSFLID